MEELADAIYATFAGNATLSASLSGGLFFEEAVQDTDYPYGVYFINNKTQETVLPASTVTNRSQIFSIQFNIWDDTRNRTTITGIESNMESAFAWRGGAHKPMTITNHTHVSTIPTGSRIIRDPEKRWQLSIDYEIRTRRQ